MDSSVSSRFQTFNHPLASQTTKNSTQASEYEDAESDDMSYVSLMQGGKNENNVDTGFTYKPLKSRGYPGSRHKELKKSFKLGLHGLLTTCSKEEFCKSFPRFTQSEQERLHREYIKVIVSMHKNIEVEFEVLCEGTKVGDVLDIVEELVEEQTLDPLYPDKTNFKDVAQVLAELKKNEIQNLTTMLEKTGAENEVLRSRVDILRKQLQDSYGASNALEKMKTGM